MKGFYVLATAAALALSAFAVIAVAAQPCGKAVIDDWYDNGTFDRTWDCECLRDAIDLLPDGAPYASATEDFQRQLEQRMCEGSAQQVVTVTATQSGAPGSDKSIRVSDSSAWEVAIVGGLALGLAALIGLALHRQRRRRRS